jgi:hypothetical protein
MAKKRKFADGGDILTSKGAKKAGEEAGRAAKTASFGKLLDRKIGEADALTSRMKVLREKGPEALAQSDRTSSDLAATAKSEREKFTDSMGSYKKGGSVKTRGDGIAQRGRTKGRFV